MEEMTNSIPKNDRRIRNQETQSEIGSLISSPRPVKNLLNGVNFRSWKETELSKKYHNVIDAKTFSHNVFKIFFFSQGDENTGLFQKTRENLPLYNCPNV